MIAYLLFEVITSVLMDKGDKVKISRAMGWLIIGVAVAIACLIAFL